MPSDKAIKVGAPSARERKKRRREIIIAGVLLAVIGVFSVIELRYLGVDSYLFLALFNLNLLLLLVVLLIVVRNAVKLILERRRKVLGSRLRTKLVLAFISLSLIPTALMFLVSLKFVQTSVDYWFKSQVERSMEQALEVGQSFYASARQRLGRQGEVLLNQVDACGCAWAGPEMDALLQDKMREYGLGLVGLAGPQLSLVALHQSSEGVAPGWEDIRAKVNWESLKEQPRYWSMLWPGQAADFVVGVMPVQGGERGYLVLAESIGQGLMYKLDQIVRGVDEYKKLKTFKQPLKVALGFTMGVLTLFIVFGAMWFGFRLAKELSAPIQALAQGTERIAKGDLSVRLDDQSQDELGVLVRSFNRMAEDLGRIQARLTEANLQLGRQNQELEQRGRYIEAVLENTAAGVISLDDQGRISTVNKAASAILAGDAKRYLGLRPEELLPPRYQELLAEVRSALRDNPDAQWQRQIDVSAGDQELRLLVNVVALQDAAGREAGLVAVFEDITELEKAQRMAAWREVAKRIAHEIKNPLTPIKLSAQRLERKFAPVADDPAFGQMTGLIVRQVEHLQQMVQEFSAFAKLPELVLREERLEPLLEEVVALFQHSHSHIAWELDAEADLPGLRFDREGLRRALVNVLTNAAEALSGTGAGRVRIAAAHAEALGRVRITVADNGPGLSAEERSRLFEPYFSRKKGGTGLGLAIVKSIVNDHGGYVRAAQPDSPETGPGTTLIIELPV
jgi:two-component system nitrogen regulation sensor histidine kinase NtrY